MNIFRTLILAIIVLLTASFSSDKPAYRIYDAKGKSIKFKKLVKKLDDADVVFFGELHDNPVCHWMQLELTRDLYIENQGKLILGAEMFEADNQVMLDEYLNNMIRQKDFEKEARLWPNYKTDYKPLVEMAHDSGLRFIATNVPRRYAALVHKKGLKALDSLSETAKKWLAPLPIAYDSTLQGYQKMLEMMKGMGHANPNLPKAQAVKDATMAHFISQNMKKGHQFIHYNGNYHSKNFEGIVWYLKSEMPDVSIKTISTVEQQDVEELNEESEDTADFFIVVDDDMTKTH